MSEHATQWLNEWVKVRVSAAPYQQQKRQATDVYGPACTADALKAGITRRELQKAANGDLLSYLESAVEDKMDVEMSKNRPAI
jgi:diaminopimelate decarboxylase